MTAKTIAAGDANGFAQQQSKSDPCYTNPYARQMESAALAGAAGLIVARATFLVAGAAMGPTIAVYAGVATTVWVWKSHMRTTYEVNPYSMRDRLTRIAGRACVAFSQEWASNHDRPRELAPKSLTEPFKRPLYFYHVLESELSAARYVDEQLLRPDVNVEGLVPLMQSMLLGLQRTRTFLSRADIAGHHAKKAFIDFENGLPNTSYYKRNADLHKAVEDWYRGTFTELVKSN